MAAVVLATFVLGVAAAVFAVMLYGRAVRVVGVALGLASFAGQR